jgi:hypothetical protein
MLPRRLPRNQTNSRQASKLSQDDVATVARPYKAVRSAIFLDWASFTAIRQRRISGR